MKKHRVKGAIVGVRFGDTEPDVWHVRLNADCPIGKAGDMIDVRKATKTSGGELEVEK